MAGRKPKLSITPRWRLAHTPKPDHQQAPGPRQHCASDPSRKHAEGSNSACLPAKINARVSLRVPQLLREGAAAVEGHLPSSPSSFEERQGSDSGWRVPEELLALVQRCKGSQSHPGLPPAPPELCLEVIC